MRGQSVKSSRRGDTTCPLHCGEGSEAGLFGLLSLLVMDLLQTQFQRSSVGLSINNFYAGGFLHADDIRSLPTSLKLQESVSQQFCEGNFSQAHNTEM